MEIKHFWGEREQNIKHPRIEEGLSMFKYPSLLGILFILTTMYVTGLKNKTQFKKPYA